jgi:hypothetical protein
MKKLLFFVLIALCTINSGFAAFPVKTSVPAATTEAVQPTAVAEQNKTTVLSQEHSTFLSRVKNRINSIFGDGDRGRREPYEGDRAMFWGLWGVLLWPLGILAIVHGIRGLGSRNGRQQDMATLGLILGIGEVLLCVLAVFFFFAFFLY